MFGYIFGLWGMVLKHVYAACFLHFFLNYQLSQAYREKVRKKTSYRHNNIFADVGTDFRSTFGTELDHSGSVQAVMDLAREYLQ